MNQGVNPDIKFLSVLSESLFNSKLTGDFTFLKYDSLQNFKGRELDFLSEKTFPALKLLVKYHKF